MKVKVKNMASSNGNDVPNQFIIETDEGTYFQSHQSIIAFMPKDKRESMYLFCKDQITFETNQPVMDRMQTHDFQCSAYLDKNKWDYSTTTGKYRNQFLGETKKETEKKIESGEYALVDLN